MKTDAEIQKNVMDELKWQPFLNAEQIGVTVKNGIVTLSGIVDTYSKKIGAEKAAKNIEGVKALVEEIEVKIPGVKNDADIAHAVLNALKWHSALREHKLKIKVESGIVTLDGEVDWAFQKDSAKMMVENISGVRGIINLITIAVKPTSKDVKQKVISAFNRNANIDAQKIDVEILGNKAILTGTVRSWAEKRDAEKAVWSAPGIVYVDNRLEVEYEVSVLD